MKGKLLVVLLVPMVLFAHEHVTQGHNFLARRRANMQHMQPPMREAESLSLTEVMLLQYLDIRPIQQEYMHHIRRIFQETRREGESLRQRLFDHEKRFFALSTNTSIQKRDEQEMMRIMEEIIHINGRLFAIQREAMRKIERLNIEREKRILNRTEAWLRHAQRNPEELRRFIDFVQKRQPVIEMTPPPADNEHNP